MKVGDLITVRIELRSDRDMEFIHMKDMRASGVEPINVLSHYKWQDGLGYYQATKANTKEATAWAGLGRCFVLQDSWEQARHFFQKAIDLKPKNSEYWLARAEMDFKIGHFASAQEAYEEVLRIDSENIAAYLGWSLLLDGQNKLNEAISLLNEALNFAPENADLMYRLVAYILKKGASKEATLYLELALFIDYAKHEQLYEFFGTLESQKAIFKLIEQLRA